MSDPEFRPEVLKLARLLRLTPDSLGFLEQVGDEDLERFREQVTDVLFDSNTGTLKRLAGAAKLLPSAVLAKIAEAVFGPLLCARIAGLIDPVKAAEVAKRLSPAFLADVAVELDPRRARAVIGALPPKVIAPVAVELASRQDWITLGRFVGYLADQPLAACVETLDEPALLHIALVVEDGRAIPRVIELLSSSQRESLLAAVVVEHHLWTELLPFAKMLPTDAQRVVADVARTLTPEVRAEILGEAERLNVLADLGPIADALTEQAA